MSDADLSLRLVRDVPISPEQCFEGWTVPERLMPWFCPRPWRVDEHPRSGLQSDGAPHRRLTARRARDDGLRGGLERRAQPAR